METCRLMDTCTLNPSTLPPHPTSPHPTPASPSPPHIVCVCQYAPHLPILPGIRWALRKRSPQRRTVGLPLARLEPITTRQFSMCHVSVCHVSMCHVIMRQVSVRRVSVCIGCVRVLSWRCVWDTDVLFCGNNKVWCVVEVVKVDAALWFTLTSWFLLVKGMGEEQNERTWSCFFSFFFNMWGEKQGVGERYDVMELPTKIRSSKYITHWFHKFLNLYFS